MEERRPNGFWEFSPLLAVGELCKKHFLKIILRISNGKVIRSFPLSKEDSTILVDNHESERLGGNASECFLEDFTIGTFWGNV